LIIIQINTFYCKKPDQLSEKMKSFTPRTRRNWIWVVYRRAVIPTPNIPLSFIRPIRKWESMGRIREVQEENHTLHVSIFLYSPAGKE